MVDYISKPYVFTSTVKNYHRLPRFGHGSDFTLLFSPNHNEQVDYAAGLIALFAFLLTFFMFWTIMLATFKVMGPANAGFLSGHHFVVPDPADDKGNISKRPLRVRVVFLIATGILMLFVFLLAFMGFNNTDKAAETMSDSLKLVQKYLGEADQISQNLNVVGENSKGIRDDAVSALKDVCPANPNIAAMAGIDLIGIAEKARTDMENLADFIKDGLEDFNEGLQLVQGVTSRAYGTIDSINVWGWPTMLLVAGLLTLPSFLAVGVGLVMLGIDVKAYQNTLTYFFLPLFTITIIACYIVCCLVLPFSVTTADACSGGGAILGGPDDTVLTIYRNLRGNRTDIEFQLVGYYTQQCNPEYEPYGFFETYLNDLDKAIDSTEIAMITVEDNKAFLEEQCDRTFDDIQTTMTDMINSLKLLRQQADRSLELIKCENLNDLYVDTFHDAGCTYSVDALGWIFAASLVISVCGLIMIMLRSAYYPEEQMGLAHVIGGESAARRPTKSST